MKILAVVPARGGSKGIKNKNIINLHGKPLISYTIEVARTIKAFETVLVSTDSEEISKIAVEYGACVLKRPKKLASDRTPMSKVLEHVVASTDESPDLICLLQPTSPLRTAHTIRRALQEFMSHISEYDSLMPLRLISGKIGSIKNNRYIPCYKLGLQRQEMPKLYKECGTIYIYKEPWIKLHEPYGKRIYPFIIDDEKEAIDIDTIKDLRLAEYFLKERE